MTQAKPAERAGNPPGRQLTKYELVAFVTGFSLLAYELAAARILAPTIGSSMYVWTSVIGVIIAALSLGYAAGGIIADKRARLTDIAWLLLAAAGTVVLTLALSDAVLSLISNSFNDPRLEGLAAATLLFSPTSFILGVISPYLAKLRIVSLKTTGTSVAFLSAANAIGGIIGTFSVGFIFFGFIGSQETLAFTAILLILCSLFFAPYGLILKRAGLGFIGLVFIASLVASAYPPLHVKGEIADIDTPSARYKIYDSTYNGQPTRLIATGPRAAQSGVYLNGSNELVFFYSQQMARLVDQTPAKERLLILGGGAFTIPSYLAEKYPDSQIDVAEIDPQLVDIAKRYFNFKEYSNLKVYSQDARTYLNDNETKYDIILVDVYSDSMIPFSLSTREYADILKSNLKPGGLVVANIIGADTPQCRPLLRALHASYVRHFPHYLVYPQVDPDLVANQNLVIAYAAHPLADSQALKPDLSGGMTLTDNFAPVERLKLQCQRSQT